MVSGSSFKILYVDDDASVANLVIKTLRGAGYEVDWAKDGEEGLNRVKTQAYDLLAVDQFMPKLNGLDVAREIITAGPHPPIVLITGSGCESLAIEALKLGVRDYLIKDMAGEYLRILPTVVGRIATEQSLIQDKVAANEALRKSEERYRVLVDRSPDAMLVFCDGVVAFANPAAVTLLGARSQDGLIGKKSADLWPCSPGVDHPSLALIERGAASGFPQSVIEDQLRRLDGTRIDVEVAMVPVLHDNQDAVQLIARDITRRKAAEDGLRRAKEELEQRVADRTKDLSELNRQLQEKIVELETFHDVAVGREHKMMSLEKDLRRAKDELEAIRQANQTVE